MTEILNLAYPWLLPTLVTYNIKRILSGKKVKKKVGSDPCLFLGDNHMRTLAAVVYFWCGGVIFFSYPTKLVERLQGIPKDSKSTYNERLPELWWTVLPERFQHIFANRLSERKIAPVGCR